jgi:1,4-dihydroxy-2-naphthoyl-CoA hydrolase
MARIGWPIEALIRDRQLALPLVHAEADYRRPMRHGDQVDVALDLLSLGDRRFSLSYEFLIGAQQVATAQSVHVAIHPDTGLSRTLPESLAAALSALPRKQ